MQSSEPGQNDPNFPMKIILENSNIENPSELELGTEKKRKSFHKIDTLNQDDFNQEDNFSDDEELEKDNNFIGKFDGEKFILIKELMHFESEQNFLYHNHFIPKTNAFATLCIIHGFGEHLGRHLHVAEYMALNGMEVHLIDLRGFGFSSGARFHTTIHNMHKDVEMLLKHVNPNLPLFLMGHSMGCTVLTSLLGLNPNLHISGVILQSGLYLPPAVYGVNDLKLAMMKLLCNDFGTVMINSEINVANLTKEKHYLKKFLNDKLMFPAATLNTTLNIFEMIKLVWKKVKEFNYPCLLIHGQEDMLCIPQNASAFYASISSKDKCFHLVEGGFHEMHFDRERRKVRKTILLWIIKHLDKNKKFGTISSLKLGYLTKNVFGRSKRYALLLIIFLLFLYIRTKLKK